MSGAFIIVRKVSAGVSGRAALSVRDIVGVEDVAGTEGPAGWRCEITLRLHSTSAITVHVVDSFDVVLARLADCIAVTPKVPYEEPSE